ncbi:MAG: RluA family pseudouridine synthase [Planctomycetota bacterium]
MEVEPDFTNLVRHRFRVEKVDEGSRLDKFLVIRFPGYSRSLLQRLVKEEHVRLNGKTTRPGRQLKKFDQVDVHLPELTRPYARPENIPLDVLYEDDVLAIINKPPNLTVHPGIGQRDGTLANALSYRFGELSNVQGSLRPGIVHRLDKDTSGVLMVAKDDKHHHLLSGQFRVRTVRKEYRAICHGVVELDADLISLPIGSDRHRPTRMAIRHDIGKASESFYETLERFPKHSYVRVFPKSGRTHQIRVHMAALGHPIVADPLYGGKISEFRDLVDRQMLHAHRLTFRHPVSGEEVTFEAPIPEDMNRLLAHLRAPDGAGPAS